MTRLQTAALAWVAVVLALLAAHILLPQRSGLFALTEVLEPYIVLTGLVGCLLAFRSTHAPARPLVLLLLLVALIRYGPAWVSFPPAPDGDPLTVAAWNIEAGPEGDTRALAGIAASDAQLIGFEELQPDAASALMDEANTPRFEFKAMSPDPTVLGVGLLSHLPILEQQSSADPPFIRAVIQPVEGGPIVAVFVVHPLPGDFDTIAGIPLALDTEKRDGDIAHIRSLIDQDLSAGRSVIVMGDVNTTEREPAYADLSAGLHDAHLDAGGGPGFSWRPPSLASLPFGLLRIDYIFTTPDLVATSSTVDCSVPSDHCRIEASLVRTFREL
jgi:endonuclease/exonuclease/phosphatase family metal-dependent hydrolase